MRKPNKIIRVKKSWRLNEDKERHLYEVKLVRLEDYLNDTTYKEAGVNYDEIPYKLYEIQRFWTIPAFIISQWLFKKRLTRWQNINIPIQITIFSMESSAAAFIIWQLYKLIF